MERGATTPSTLTVALSLVALCISLASTGCGGENESAGGGASATGSPPIEKTIAGKTEPNVVTPDLPPPRKLVIEDIEVGHGPQARIGDDVEVEFVGINPDGLNRISSWSYPSPPVFELGGREPLRLYYGLDLGVRGMRPGGRRKVTIPPKLVRWPDAPYVHLERNNTFAFVVDLLAIK